jgi:hypothetical protein
MFNRFLSLIGIVLIVMAAPAAFADSKAHEGCNPKFITIDPDDGQTATQINLSDGTITANAVATAAFAAEDTFITNVPLKFSNLRAIINTAPGTTGGTDTRTITVNWDPPGATPLQSSSVSGTLPAARGSFGCVLTGTATTCNSFGKGVFVPIGSTVAIRVNSIISPSAPDAATELGLSFCMTPTQVVGLNP